MQGELHCDSICVIIMVGLHLMLGKLGQAKSTSFVLCWEHPLSLVETEGTIFHTPQDGTHLWKLRENVFSPEWLDTRDTEYDVTKHHGIQRLCL